MAKRYLKFISKLIFSLSLPVFALFVLTCNFSIPGMDKTDETVWTDVVYTDDGKGVKIYLEGGEYAPASRALSLPLAKLGHDFFEVVFLHNEDNNPANYKVARAFWESGQNAVISGVSRGVNYSNISMDPPLGEGSAVLFVGRKEDKTLLALGTLIHVDGGPGTVITNTTKSVTFEVDAIKGGIHKNAANSSFKTSALSYPGQTVNSGSTEIIDARVVAKSYPLFRLSTASMTGTISAEYSFELDKGGQSGFNAFGIIAANAGTTLDKIIPQYTLPNGAVFKHSGQTDTATIVTLANNQPHTPPAVNGAKFDNPVKFSFAMNNAPDPSVFGFIFSMAVNALSAQGEAVRWYLRPGFGKYLYDLDDGLGGTGGAILLGTGDFSTVDNHGLVMSQHPSKHTYSNVTGWYIDLSGMVLVMMDNGAPQGGTIPHNDLNLKYSLDGLNWITYSEIIAVSLEGKDGNQWIHLRYTTVNGEYYTSFHVTIGNVTLDISDIPEDNRRFIAYGGDLTYFQNMVNDNTNANTAEQKFLMVVNLSVDFSTFTLNNGPHTIVVLAGNDGVIIGRGNAGINYTNINNQNKYYFGTWPFADPICVGGNVVNSRPFTLNAGGSWTAVRDNLAGSPGYSPAEGGQSIVTLTGTVQPMISNVTAENLNIGGNITVYSRDLIIP